MRRCRSDAWNLLLDAFDDLCGQRRFGSVRPKIRQNDPSHFTDAEAEHERRTGVPMQARIDHDGCCFASRRVGL